MSLTLAPYGLSLYEYKGGKNKFSTSVYHLADSYGASIGQGDPVNIGLYGSINVSTPSNAPTPPYPAQSFSQVLGQAVSFSWITPNGVSMKDQPYWPAGTKTLNSVGASVTVADLPMNVYKIQANAPCGTAVAPFLFYNFDFSNCLSTSLPNPRTSQSTAYLDINTGVNTTNYWLAAKIVGLAPSSITGGPNAWSDPYPEVLITINNHAFKSGTNGANS